MKSYTQKLKDPRWQKLRLQVFERDNWACSMCGDASSTLHVHHGYYATNRDPWEYASYTLHTVCEECHPQADALRLGLHHECASLSLHRQAWMRAFADWLSSMDDLSAREYLEKEMPKDFMDYVLENYH